MKRKNLCLLVGPPASGKSTFMSRVMPMLEKARCISRDEIRFALVAEDEPYFSREDEVFDCFINEIRKSLNINDTTFVDATHVSEGSRKKLIKHINPKNVDVYCIVFTTPTEICIERNLMRTGRRQVPEKVIHNMKNGMTDPVFDKFQYAGIYYINEDGEVKKRDLFNE